MPGGDVAQVAVQTRVEVTTSGSSIRGGSTAKLRRTTHHDLFVETGDGRRVRLLTDTSEAAVEAFARALAGRLGRPLVRAV